MEQETILKEILSVLNDFSKKNDKRFDEMEQRFEKIDNRFDEMEQRFEKIDNRFDEMEQRFEKMDKRFDQVDKKIDDLGTKYDGLHIELHETQETTDFTVKKVMQHEKKLRKMNTL